MWPCTGEECGECNINNPFRSLIDKSHIAAVKKYFKIFHRFQEQPVLVCKKCNMGIYNYMYMIHLSEHHGRVTIWYSHEKIIVGLYNNYVVCIDYGGTIARYPQLIYLSAAPGNEMKNIIDEDEVKQLLIRHFAENRNGIIHSIVCINDDDEIYPSLVNSIMQKMTVCADCGMDYDCPPSNEMIYSHISGCS